MTTKLAVVEKPDVIEFIGGDPTELVKVITLGICTAGLRAFQHLAGQRPQPPLPVAAPNDEVMTADDVAVFLGVDRKTVYDFAGRGVIPHRRLGKRMLFSRSGLVSWLSAWSKGSSDGGSG